MATEYNFHVTLNLQSAEEAKRIADICQDAVLNYSSYDNMSYFLHKYGIDYELTEDEDGSPYHVSLLSYLMADNVEAARQLNSEIWRDFIDGAHAEGNQLVIDYRGNDLNHYFNHLMESVDEIEQLDIQEEYSDEYYDEEYYDNEWDDDENDLDNVDDNEEEKLEFTEREMESLNESQRNAIENANREIKEPYKEVVTSMLRKHPEWSSSLMNFVTDTYQKGKDVEPLLTFGLATVVHHGQEAGKVGDLTMLLSYDTLEKLNLVTSAVECLKENPNLTDNELIYQTLVRNNNMLNDRIKLTGDLAEYKNIMLAVMSEGKDDVKQLLEDIYFHSNEVDKEATQAWNQSGAMFGHLMVGNAYLLKLDDMNIRGDQVKYAYEYCNNDFSTLINKINDRDEEMIKYVNYRAVEEAIKNNQFSVQKAVCYGASFELPRKILASEFDKTPVKSLKIDYKNREILHTTSLDEAIKIFEANGFETVYNKAIMTAEDNYVNKGTHCLVMQNPETGAILSAPSARTDCVVYGGCEILLPYEKPDTGDYSKYLDNLMHLNFTANFIDGQKDMCVASFNYNNNMIQTYNEAIKELNPIKDSTVLGYEKMEGIALPETEKIGVFCPINKEWKHPELIAFGQGFGGIDFQYDIDKLYKCLNLENAMKDVAPDKQWIYKPFLDNKYQQTMNSSYFSQEVRKNSLLMGVLFKMNDIPNKEIDEYYKAAMEECKKNDFHKDDFKWLKKNQDVFYGESKLTKDFIDEFDLKEKEIVIENKSPEVQDETIDSQTHEREMIEDFIFNDSCSDEAKSFVENHCGLSEQSEPVIDEPELD